MPELIRHTIEILDRNLDKVGEARSLYPLNDNGMILRYSEELSDWGRCEFRIATEDHFFAEFGDILVPHKYHVRIKRGDNIAWQGAIVDNPSRNKNFISVLAHEYLWYFDKGLVQRNTEIETGSGKHYRIFDSGTLASNISDIITELIAAFGPDHILAGVTLGTLENPDFPASFVNADGNPLTGPWSFSEDVKLQFDYHMVLYILKAFGIYASCDFGLDRDLVFNWKKFLGVKNPKAAFEFGQYGNIIDYDVPRLGRRMVNDMWGIAAQPDGTILHANKRDEASILEYGLLQGPAAYTDIKDKNNLAVRMAEELRFLSQPDAAPINLILNEKSYPTGRYNVGDLVPVKIKDGLIDYAGTRRIAGHTVAVHDTGRETIYVQTERPKATDMGA